jgi:hypothetical protein
MAWEPGFDFQRTDPANTCITWTCFNGALCCQGLYYTTMANLIPNTEFEVLIFLYMLLPSQYSSSCRSNVLV